MSIEKPIEKQNISEETKAVRTEPAKVIEMGAVSVETKGIARGLELGFTPKS